LDKGQASSLTGSSAHYIKTFLLIVILPFGLRRLEKQAERGEKRVGVVNLAGL